MIHKENLAEYTLPFLFEYQMTEINALNSKGKKIGPLKTTALCTVLARVAAYEEAGFSNELCKLVFYNKSMHIIQAASKKDLKEITDLPKPYMTGHKFESVNTPWHCVEEEMIQWSLASLKAPLNEMAFTRYMKLFSEYQKVINDRE